MKSEDLQAWLQIAGLFGVIASLIFVGLEMRQAQQIARSEAMQARTDTTVFAILEAASNPYVLSASAKPAEERTGEEQSALYITNTALLFSYENIFLQYQSGFIPNERWEATRSNLKLNLENTSDTGFRSIFESSPSGWSKSFGALVNELTAEIDRERGD